MIVAIITGVISTIVGGIALFYIEKKLNSYHSSIDSTEKTPKQTYQISVEKKTRYKSESDRATERKVSIAILTFAGWILIPWFTNMLYMGIFDSKYGDDIMKYGGIVYFIVILLALWILKNKSRLFKTERSLYKVLLTWFLGFALFRLIFSRIIPPFLFIFSFFDVHYIISFCLSFLLVHLFIFKNPIIKF